VELINADRAMNDKQIMHRRLISNVEKIIDSASQTEFNNRPTRSGND